LDKKEKKERKREKRERKAVEKEVKRPRKEKRAKTPQNKGGQTTERAADFRDLARGAYPSDCEENIRAKKFTQIFLDGNNMLFVKSVLRNLTLAHKRAQAEKILASAALAFAQLVGTSVEIIFDCTCLPSGDDSVATFTGTLPSVGSRIVLSGGNTFLLSSARPHFSTSDDKLISWARFNLCSGGNPKFSGESIPVGPNPNGNILVVSSDRALAGELNSLGVTLLGPKRWFLLFEKLLTEASPAGAPSASSKDVFDDWCARCFPELQQPRQQ